MTVIYAHILFEYCEGRGGKGRKVGRWGEGRVGQGWTGERDGSVGA